MKELTISEQKNISGGNRLTKVLGILSGAFTFNAIANACNFDNMANAWHDAMQSLGEALAHQSNVGYYMTAY